MFGGISSGASWFFGLDDDEVKANVTSVPLASTHPWGPIENRGTPVTSPFPFDPSLSVRIYVGDIITVETDACVVFEDSVTLYGTGDGIGDTPASRLRRVGGYAYCDELQHVLRDRLRSGDVRISKAPPHLPMDRVIHTVGPKYKMKYSIAAQNTLTGCVRESFLICQEEKCRTISMPMIYSKTSDFPLEMAAHTMLRSTRRWLERLDAVDTVVFVGTQEDAEILCPLLPIYFPRSHEEAELMLPHMSDVQEGNKFGELETIDREIRLESTFIHHDSEENDTSDALDLSFLQKSARPSEDFDEACRRRVSATAWECESQEEVHRVYQRYLREARKYNFDHLIRRGFLIFEIVNGRKVVTILGSLFPGHIDPKVLVLFIVSYLDPKIKDRYCLLYIHTGVVLTENAPSWTLFCEMMRIFTTQFTPTLEKVVILHPDLVFKAMFSVAALMFAHTLWPGAVYAETILDMKYHLGPVQLPDFVRDYDRTI